MVLVEVTTNLTYAILVSGEPAKSDVDLLLDKLELHVKPAYYARQRPEYFVAWIRSELDSLSETASYANRSLLPDSTLVHFQPICLRPSLEMWFPSNG
jgi:hypothetical protein